MNCPSCNHPNAYVGFSTVECQNSTCRHYKPISATEEEIEAVQKMLSEAYNDPNTEIRLGGHFVSEAFIKEWLIEFNSDKENKNG